jgi:biopolymer transport protein ExbD
VLTVAESGLTLNRTPVATMDDLDARLRELLPLRADKTVFLRAAGEVRYGRVVEVMDVAQGAGIGILTRVDE